MGGELLTGRYEIQALLVRDSSGEQWLAADLEMRRSVVIWLSRPDLRASSAVAAQADRYPPIARVVHPNVARTYDAGRAADGRDYLVREFVDGTDLATLSRDRGPLPAGEVADLAVQLARGLDAVHAAGAVLGRVEPADQVLTSGGTVKIAGLDSAAVGPAVGRPAGDPAYVAPERVAGHPASSAGDWYGLGCVLYQLLVGRPPFTGDVQSVLAAQVWESATSVRRLRPDADPWLAALVDRLLAKDPNRRPTSAAEFEPGRPAAPAVLHGEPVLRAEPVVVAEPVVLGEPVVEAALLPSETTAETAVIRLPVPPPFRRRAPILARARRLTGAGSVVTAVIVVAAGAMLFGTTGEGQAQSGAMSIDGGPSHPATARPSSPPTPRAPATRRPSREQTTPRPTVTATTTPVVHSSQVPDPAAPLRSLAGLLRADRRAERVREVRLAAMLLEEAAAGGPTHDLVQAALGQLAVAERTDSWHPSAPESTLLSALGYHSPSVNHSHTRHED